MCARLVCSLKENMQTLIEKTSNDDKLIDALKTELRKKPAATKPAPATATTTGRIGDRASGSAVSLSVPALEALERKTVEQQGQILRQEKIILALQQQVAAAAAAAPAGLHVLEVEKEKLEQLVEVFRERVEQAQAATADARACALVCRTACGGRQSSEKYPPSTTVWSFPLCLFSSGLDVRMPSVRRWCVAG
jgi:DNA repair exonuclease SbcCD ATPase subunit